MSQDIIKGEGWHYNGQVFATRSEATIARIEYLILDKMNFYEEETMTAKEIADFIYENGTCILEAISERDGDS